MFRWLQGIALLLVIGVAGATFARASQPADRPTQSVHRHGPEGLEGWTLEAPVRDSGYGDERFAFALVIARHGRIVRRINGDPFIWKWIFRAGGREIAYATGPFHFSETCLLVRLADGKRLDGYDCYHDRPAVRPDWVKALQAGK